MSDVKQEELVCDYTVLPLDENSTAKEWREVIFTTNTGIEVKKSVRYMDDKALFQNIIDGQLRGFENRVKMGLHTKEQNPIGSTSVTKTEVTPKPTTIPEPTKKSIKEPVSKPVKNTTSKAPNKKG